MSLTEAEAVFASVHETALNDILTAFATERPRHFVYGSPNFVPSTTAAATRMDAISFPGIPGGIHWAVALTAPKIDLFEQTNPLPPELTLNPGQFSGELTVMMCIDCRRRRVDTHDSTGGPFTHVPPNPDGVKATPRPTCFRVQVFVVGHLERVPGAGGEDSVILAVDAVEIVDIEPDELESFLECLISMILQAVLADIRLPLRALRAGAFELVPTVGPLIEEDQIKMRGNV